MLISNNCFSYCVCKLITLRKTQSMIIALELQSNKIGQRVKKTVNFLREVRTRSNILNDEMAKISNGRSHAVPSKRSIQQPTCSKYSKYHISHMRTIIIVWWRKTNYSGNESTSRWTYEFAHNTHLKAIKIVNLLHCPRAWSDNKVLWCYKKTPWCEEKVASSGNF